jgi:ABC-type polysaccharide/polyol phosphate transport system ATPase subunit
MSEEIAIKVDGVSKDFRLPHEKTSSLKGALINLFRGGKSSYEVQKALQDISFDIKKGEFFGIVGRNGSGKSTLLKLLARIYTPTEGEIGINGKLTPFIELGVGFNQELSGRENVYLNGALLGFNRKEMEAMYEDIVEFAELERFMDQKLKNYSSGMQVRLAFSIAIRAKSDILLLDEVLAVGDAAFQQKCYNYFEELKRENQTVVFVSHDMGAVRRFCTKAVYIKDGVLTDIGSASEIADIYTAENIESAQKAAEKSGEISGAQTITSKIVEQKKNQVLVRVDYTSKTDDEMYVGISVLRDGVSVAEIITSLDSLLRGNGTVTYTLDTTLLNGGIYQVDAALFSYRNKELLCFTKAKSKFTIKGSDMRRGGSLRLEDTWKYGKN